MSSRAIFTWAQPANLVELLRHRIKGVPVRFSAL